jgi:tRNA dimethylallyltransferase
MTFLLTNKLLIVITGPTASGKTAIGVKLAKHFNSEVISADSRQFYKQLKIGTARPQTVELESVPHHFLGFLDLKENFSAGKFASVAQKLTDELFKKHDVLFVVGGSGLYIDALIYGIDDIPKIDPEIREEINNKWKKHGLVYLKDKLKKIDPFYYQQIDNQNPMRLIRAIEVFKQTGKSLSFFQKNKNKTPRYKTIFIGLDWERQTLYERINQRVDTMLKDGLVKEVKSLYKYRKLNALQTVGYSETFEYLDGEIELETAIDLIKRNSRRYAKRQLTWLRRNSEVQWFQPEKIKWLITLIDKEIARISI